MPLIRIIIFNIPKGNIFILFPFDKSKKLYKYIFIFSVVEKKIPKENALQGKINVAEHEIK